MSQRKGLEVEKENKMLNDFRSWLLDKESAPRFMYHLGFLARDRWVNWQLERSPINKPVNDLAKAAWDAYEDGLVHLVQFREADDTFGYWAIKTSVARA